MDIFLDKGEVLFDSDNDLFETLAETILPIVLKQSISAQYPPAMIQQLVKSMLALIPDKARVEIPDASKITIPSYPSDDKDVVNAAVLETLLKFGPTLKYQENKDGWGLNLQLTLELVKTILDAFEVTDYDQILNLFKKCNLSAGIKFDSQNRPTYFAIDLDAKVDGSIDVDGDTLTIVADLQLKENSSAEYPTSLGLLIDHNKYTAIDFESFPVA